MLFIQVRRIVYNKKIKEEASNIYSEMPIKTSHNKNLGAIFREGQLFTN